MTSRAFPNCPPLCSDAVERMKSESATRAILVVAKSPTPFAKTTLQDLASHTPKYLLETFLESEVS